MVDRQQHHGFDELGLHHRPPDGHDGLVGEDGGALRHRPNVAGEAEVFQIIQKGFAEQLFSPQVGDILFGEGEAFQVVHQLLHTRHDRQTAVIRHPAEEHIEVGDAVPAALPKKAVGHGELVKIGQQGQIVAAILFFQHINHVLSGIRVRAEHKILRRRDSRREGDSAPILIGYHRKAPRRRSASGKAP